MQAYSSIFLDRLLIFHPPLNDDSIATKESSSKDVRHPSTLVPTVNSLC
jgi:hypothetical protein